MKNPIIESAVQELAGEHPAKVLWGDDCDPVDYGAVTEAYEKKKEKIRTSLEKVYTAGIKEGETKAWERLDALPKFIASDRVYTLRIKPLPKGKLEKKPARWMVRYLAGDRTLGATEAPTLAEAVEMMHARLANLSDK